LRITELKEEGTGKTNTQREREIGGVESNEREKETLSVSLR
jgi:hypothetical protein